MNEKEDHDCKLETDGTCECEKEEQKIYAEDEESIIL